MSPIESLRGLGYEILESLIKMNRETKLGLVAMSALIVYIKIGQWAGFDPRVVFGTTVGLMLAVVNIIHAFSQA